MTNKNFIKTLWLWALLMVVGNVNAQVTTQEEFVSACANAVSGDVITLGSGEFAIGPVDINGKTLTFKGQGATNTKIYIGNGGYDGNGGHGSSKTANMTFEDLELADLAANSGYLTGFTEAAGLTFRNVTFNVGFSNWGNKGGDVSFYNCTFNQTLSDKYCIQELRCAPNTKFLFDGCEMTAAGRFINAYKQGGKSTKIEVTVKDCQFHSTAVKYGAVYLKNATNNGNDGCSIDLKFEGTNTIDGNYITRESTKTGSALFQEKGTSDATVYVGGIKIWENSAKTADYIAPEDYIPSTDTTDDTPAVYIPEDLTVEGADENNQDAHDAIIELAHNDNVNADDANNVEDVEDVDALTINLTNVVFDEDAETTTITKVVYDVQPMNGDTEVNETSEPITFRLPVPQSFKGSSVKVSHSHNDITTSTYEIVEGEGANKYVTLSSDKFSEWTLEDINPNTVAVIGDNQYSTLAEAVIAANADDEIVLVADQEITSAIEIAKNITLNLNGKTITNNVASNRLFRVGDATFTIDGTIGGSSMIIPETNKYSFGFVDMRNNANTASSSAKLILKGGYYEGATLGGAFFKGRNHYQTFELSDVHCKCTVGDGQQYYANGYYYNGDNASVVNAYGFLTTMKVVGGLYEYNTLAKTATNVFQGINFMENGESSVSFDDVKIVSSHGPIYELSSGEMTINNCDFTIEGASTWQNSALCASNNAVLNVNGTKFDAPYSVYALTSGATININGGEFIGSKSLLVAGTDNYYPTAVSTINVFDGEFKYTGNNPSEAIYTYGNRPVNIAISGGHFNVDPTNYCSDGYKAVENGDGTWTVQAESTKIAQIGAVTYSTLAEALIAAQSGDVIEILNGTWGAEDIGKLDEPGKYTNANIVRYKSLTIQPAEGANPTFTSTVSLGYDDSSTANATMTVKGLNFDGASLQLSNYVQATVEDCNFTNGTSATNGVLVVQDACCTNHKTAENYPASQITIKNCSINGSNDGASGIRLRNSGSVTIEDCTIANSKFNGILFESNGSVDNSVIKTIDFKNNNINEWNSANTNGGGRGMRLALGTLAEGSTVTLDHNTFTKETTGLDTPDFAKITGMGTGSVTLNGNNWNNMTDEEVINDINYFTSDEKISAFITKTDGTTVRYGVAADVILEDANIKSVVVNEEADVKSITYKRTFNKSYGSWQSWIVPFNTRVDAPDEVRFAKLIQFAYLDEDKKVVDDISNGKLYIIIQKLFAGEEVHANYPYFVKVETQGEHEFTSCDNHLYTTTPNSLEANTTTTEIVFHGVYNQTTLSDIYMLNTSGEYSHMTEDKVVNPYRWYFTIKSKDAYGENNSGYFPDYAKILVMGEDEEATAILNIINSQKNDGAMYDLSGRRIQNAQKGVYIVNGKKYIK